ncbi:unnamed protein product (macronuclear) [Paramecium tetraurelia]|uniref:Uncharacterized protein n=1 Tax=Paramecium tetraurelia TaxID=5888 RepID=A0DNL9_PARTE|nr:uncharacterized protein GSPATT00018832001 [Paramecium tetraurelia]CAK84636.1 unnamed protein product [Paramecium tetraurelia]|eukprot:XP_001452033.1 hypothetical protein (macronuclear) [Paramecium tetraurelia strain d4-2]
MFIINSIAITNDQKYVIGATNTGALYFWDFENILLENSSRTQEKTQNTLIYKASYKFPLFKDSIQQILLIQENLYCVVANKLYQVQMSSLISPNQIIDTDLNSSIMIQSFQEEIEFIKYNNEILIVAVGSRLYFIDLQHENNIIEEIDITQSINDNIYTLVPIKDVKITSLAVIGQNFLAIGSDIGIIGIWSISTYSFQSVLSFKGANQELSYVNDILYMEDEQQIISLHKNYLVIWNSILRNDDEIRPISDYYKMCSFQNNIYLTKGNRQIEQMNSKITLQTSSDVILQFSTISYQNSNVLIANGSSPFVDIYVDKNYTLTLSCL